MSDAATKTCNKCGEVKAADLFPVSKAKAACKACAADWARKNYAKHKAIAEVALRRVCAVCDQEKSSKEFAPTTNQCKSCRRAYWQKWANNNATHLVRYEKNRYAKNREAELAHAKRWAQENRDKSNAIKRGWAQRNPCYQRDRYEKRKAENPDLVRKASREQSASAREKLTNSAVKANMPRDIGIPARLIPPLLVEVKRKHLQILRKLKENPNEQQSKNP